MSICVLYRNIQDIEYDLPMSEMLEYVETKIGQYYTEIMNVYGNLTQSQMNKLGELDLMEGEVRDQIEYFQNNLSRYFPEISTDFELEIAYVDPAM